MASKLDKYTPLIKTAMDRAKENDVYAIVRMQDQKGRVVEILDGKTEGKTDLPTKGVGISVFTKDGTIGFASTSRLDEEHVKQAVDEAAEYAKISSKYEDVKCNKEVFYLDQLNGIFLQDKKYDISLKTSNEIEEIVRQINKETKSLDDRMSVRTIYACAEEDWRIVRSDGTDVMFNMPRSRIFTTLLLKEGKKISQAHFGTQGLDYSVILDDDKKHIYYKRAKITAGMVSELLNAGKIAGGHYKTLLSHNFIGLYAHEAVGHAFETDDLLNSTVGHEGKLMIGKKVTQEGISFIDGPVEGIFGNQFISANGVERKTVEFIKDGIITDGLSDVFSAKEGGVGINGCGRAQIYAHNPICRMSVTRMVDENPYPFEKTSLEDVTLDEIYELLVKHDELKPGEKIVYPVGGMGGQVSPVEGTFVFNSAGIYLLENPKKITLCKQAIFSGDTLKTIATRVKGVGEVVLDGAGVCGKMAQGAPVSDGGNLLFIIDKTPDIIFGGE